jgi:hypothetical protein
MIPAYFPRSDGGNRSPSKSERHYGPGAYALDCAEGDELIYGLAGTADSGTDEEHNYPADEEPLPSVHIAQLGDNRKRDCGSYHVGCDHPRVLAEAAEVGDYLRQRGANDCLVKRRKELGQHQSRQSEYYFAPGQLGRSGFGDLGITRNILIYIFACILHLTPSLSEL